MDRMWACSAHGPRQPKRLVAFLDGGYYDIEKVGGAGVFFPPAPTEEDIKHDASILHEKCRNVVATDCDWSKFSGWFIVPQPSAPCPPGTRMNCVRAELYAALACVHIINVEMRLPLCCLRLFLWFDSLIALNLLQFVNYHPKCTVPFSRFLERCKSEGIDFKANFSWGEELTIDQLAQYSDILDVWWFYVRGKHGIHAESIVYKKVKAHTLDSSVDGDDGGEQVVSPEAVFNDVADQLAADGTKAAARLDPQDLDAVLQSQAERGLPLSPHARRTCTSSSSSSSSSSMQPTSPGQDPSRKRPCPTLDGPDVEGGEPRKRQKTAQHPSAVLGDPSGPRPEMTSPPLKSSVDDAAAD